MHWYVFAFFDKPEQVILLLIIWTKNIKTTFHMNLKGVCGENDSFTVLLQKIQYGYTNFSIFKALEYIFALVCTLLYRFWQSLFWKYHCSIKYFLNFTFFFFCPRIRELRLWKMYYSESSSLVKFLIIIIKF